MVESSRKHGPFDRRYPVLPKLAAPASKQQPGDGAERLDWSAFLTRFFPNLHRHDRNALAAYEAYAPARAARLGRVVLPSAAVLAWEWEGGTSAG
jgi:hypothetical protein